MSTTYSAELSSLSDSSGIESLTDSMSGWSIDFKEPDFIKLLPFFKKFHKVSHN